MSADEVDQLVASIRMADDGVNSAFEIQSRRLRISSQAGYPSNLTGYAASQYNELVAITEVAHELGHAQRFARWIKRGGSVDDFWTKYGRGPGVRDGGKRYYLEEIRIETAANRNMRAIIEPRIEHLRLTGQIDEADRLSGLLRIANDDSAAYIRANTRRLPQ